MKLPSTLKMLKLYGKKYQNNNEISKYIEDVEIVL